MSTEKRKYELHARADRQRETRSRIVEATVALHMEVGPARTTVAEIARRARVQRLTVYNHFPSDADLFAACQRSFLTEHPPPDFAPALALEDPGARVSATLEALYGSYRERAPMTGRVLSDRAAIPALDRLMERTMDAQLAGLAQALTSGFRARGSRRRRVHAILALALDFRTWQRLDNEGLDDAAAAELMAELVVTAAPGGPSSDATSPRS